MRVVRVWCVCVHKLSALSLVDERFGWDQGPGGSACLAIAIGALRRYHCQLSRERGKTWRVLRCAREPRARRERGVLAGGRR